MFFIRHVLKLCFLFYQKAQADKTNLDPLGKEVSSLGNILRCGECRRKLRDDIGSTVGGLADEAECADHGKTAVLDLLKLLLGIFLGGVVKAEGIPRSGVANSNVADHAVLPLRPDALDALVFEPGHASHDLVNGRVGNRGQGLEGVHFRERVDSAELVDAREVSGQGEDVELREERRPDEAHDRELGDAPVREFGLAQPLQIGHEVSLDVQRVVERGEGGGGEADGIEADVAGEGAVEGIG